MYAKPWMGWAQDVLVVLVASWLVYAGKIPNEVWSALITALVTGRATARTAAASSGNSLRPPPMPPGSSGDADTPRETPRAKAAMRAPMRTQMMVALAGTVAPLLVAIGFGALAWWLHGVVRGLPWVIAAAVAAGALMFASEAALRRFFVVLERRL